MKYSNKLVRDILFTYMVHKYNCTPGDFIRDPQHRYIQRRVQGARYALIEGYAPGIDVLFAALDISSRCHTVMGIYHDHDDKGTIVEESLPVVSDILSEFTGRYYYRNPVMFPLSSAVDMNEFIASGKGEASPC